MFKVHDEIFAGFINNGKVMVRRTHPTLWGIKTIKLKTLITYLLTSCIYPLVGTAKAASYEVYWEEADNGHIILYADNRDIIPGWVTVSLSKVKNLRPSQQPPFIFTLKANSKKIPLFSLIPIKSAGAAHFELSTRKVPGKPPSQTHHNDQHIYQLPFTHGQKYRLGQGYFGSATHKKPNPYALDFNMDIGTAICAARDGIVAEVKQDSNIGGPSPRFAKHGNHITLYHQDGTFATYAHLKKNGALVKPGDRVRAGQKMGLSGNTGQSSGPHLHFEVFQYNTKGESRNLPVSFLNHDNSTLSRLKEGQFYYATTPGQAKYPVVLATELTNQDFTDATSTTAKTHQFEITTKKIDDAVALFAKNGKTSAMAMELSLTLDNYRASKTVPLTALIPPLTEQFLLLLQPIDASKGGKYGYSLKNTVVGQVIDDKSYKNHQVRVSQTNKMHVRQQTLDDKTLLYASNGFKVSKTLILTLEMTNMTASQGAQLTVKIPPLTEVYLQHVRPVAVLKSSKLAYSYKWR